MRDATDLEALVSYIIGFMEGATIADRGSGNPLFVLQDVSADQVILVLHKYLSEHLNDLHQSASVLVGRALLENFKNKRWKMPANLPRSSEGGAEPCLPSR